MLPPDALPRTLLLMRHAQALPATRGQRDIDRPLAAAGIAAVPRVAARVQELGLVPSAVIHSTARRTMETADLMVVHLAAQGLACGGDRTLFTGMEDEVLALVQTLAQEHPTILIVGHHPSLQHAAHVLAGTGSPSDLAALASDFPTAALAAIRFADPHWRHVAPATGTLLHYLRD